MKLKKWKEMTEQEKREVVAFGLGVGVTAVVCGTIHRIGKKRRSGMSAGQVKIFTEEAMPGFDFLTVDGKSKFLWLFNSTDSARSFAKDLEECITECEAAIGSNQFNDAIEAATDAIKEVK